MRRFTFDAIDQLLANAQSRFRRARAGSVLILVVALLVLMALIGTAYIATARTDRFTTRQHVANVQIDLLVQGVVEMAVGAITNDLYEGGASGSYRLPERLPDSTLRDPVITPAPPPYVNVPHPYAHYDSPTAPQPSYYVNNAGGYDPLPTMAPADTWMAPRLPHLLDQAAVMDTAYGPPAGYRLNPPIWESLSYPLIETTTDYGATYPWHFDTPYWPKHSSGLAYYDGGQMPPSDDPNVLPMRLRKYRFEPSAIEMPANSGRFYPALYKRHPLLPDVNNWNTAGPLAPRGVDTQPMLAADADGDGIADAGLWKLPVGTIDGVTYYAATRIIDNNSAININTAYANVEFAEDGTPMAPWAAWYGMMPGHVGLREMLRTFDPAGGGINSAANYGEEFLELSKYRTGAESPPVLAAREGLPFGVILGPGLPQEDAAPYDRADFRYRSIGDANAIQLASRLDNPGVNYLSPAGVPTRFRAFSISDSAALAYRFCLLNGAAGRSIVEDKLRQSLTIGPRLYTATTNPPVPSRPYDAGTANGLNDWYNYNFYFDAPVLPAFGGPESAAGTPAQRQEWPRPRRALLTARNPVSYAAPTRSMAALILRNPEIVDNPPTGSQDLMPPESVPNASVKASINTAPFGELWKAFWNVMSEGDGTLAAPGADTTTKNIGTPFDPEITRVVDVRPAPGEVRDKTAAPWDEPTINNPYEGTQFPLIGGGVNEPSNYNPLEFVNDPNTGAFTFPLTVPITGWHPARMFRSAIRAVPLTVAVPWNANTPRLPAYQMLLLRAAIAAVNAEDLRDSDDDVTAHRIRLKSILNNGLEDVDVVVYGNERQPFITEVYANNSGADVIPGGAGYIAIELYNPYDKDIPLTNWKIAALNRSTGIVNNPLAVGAMPHEISMGVETADPGDIHDPGSTLLVDFDPVMGAGIGPTAPAIGAPIIVPAKGFLLIENVGVAERPPAMALVPPPMPGNTPAARVAGVITPGQVNGIVAAGLSGMPDAPAWLTGIRSAFDRELVLLRPRRADGQYSVGEYPGIPAATPAVPVLYYDERPPYVAGAIAARDNTWLRDFVPVDSFDFTGLPFPGGPIAEWHYQRQTMAAGASGGWRFVYPGRYSADAVSAPVGSPRHQGTSVTIPPAAPPPVFFGVDKLAASYPVAFPIQLSNTDFGGPNKMGSAWRPDVTYQINDIVFFSDNWIQDQAANPPVRYRCIVANTTLVNPRTTPANWQPITGLPPQQPNFGYASQIYPYGGFARNGDILQVPFIGAYRITRTLDPLPLRQEHSVLEINAITMDSVFAEDTDLEDDPIYAPAVLPEVVDTGLQHEEREQIGRFVPLRVINPTPVVGALITPDYLAYPTAPPPVINYTYTAAPATRGPVVINDFGYDPSFDQSRPLPAGASQGANWQPWWRYHFANRLFDYLTVRTPASDHMANYPIPPMAKNTHYRYGQMVTHKIDIGIPPTATPTDDIEVVLVCTPLPGINGENDLTTPDPLPDPGTPAGAAYYTANWGSWSDNRARASRTYVRCSSIANNGSLTGEERLAEEGVININTASWKVLASLPLVLDAAGNVDRPQSELLAKAIVYWRDVNCSSVAGTTIPHGPFRSLFELNEVVDSRPIPPGDPSLGFRNAWGNYVPTFGIPDTNDTEGDISPQDGVAGTPLTDEARGDFEERHAQLIRLSNLLTTRSDSFTAYILVQGWRNAETDRPELVVQRRVAYILDRSKVPFEPVKRVYVPND